MTTRLKFLHVCERSFAGLPGDDAQRRRCDQCATVVHNLDAMTDAERVAVLGQATRERTTVCVSLTVPAGEVASCRAGEPTAVPPVTGPGPGPMPMPEFGVPLTGVVARPAVEFELAPEPWVVRESFGGSQTFGEDLPTVVGALTEAASELGLSEETGGREARWTLRRAAPDVTAEVAATVIRGATTVTLSIVAAGVRQPLATPRIGPWATLAPMLLSVAGAVWLGGALSVWLLALGLVVVWVSVYSLALALMRWRASPVRPAVAWGRAWERRFWATLRARLVARPPYRAP